MIALCGMDFDDLESLSTYDSDLDAELDDVAHVSCPYCGEAGELSVDPGGGVLQEYVEDCEVCCQPWLVRVRFDGEGQASVIVATLDDE